MKLQKHQLNKKKILGITLGALLALCLIVAASWYVVAMNNTETNQGPNEVNLEPPTENQIDEGQRIKEDSLTDEAQENSNNILMTVTSFTKTSDLLQLRVFIDYVSNGGVCTISFTSESATLDALQTVDTQSLPHGSTCAGFDIPLSDLAGSSSWIATVKYVNGDKNASVTKEINL